MPTESRAKLNASLLRVLLVSSSSGSQGGGELYLASLAEGLSRLGHEVHVALSDHARMDHLADITEPFGRIHRLSFRNTYDHRLRSVGSLLDRSAAKCFPSVVSGIGADVVHLNKQNLEDGLDLLKTFSRLDVPLVSTIHVTRSATNLRASGGFVRDMVSRRLLKSTKYFAICVADQCRNDFLRFLSEPGVSSRCFAVPNGVDEAHRADRSAIRKDWGCSPNDVVLGTIARIEDQKNPLMAAKVLSKLPAKYRFVWVGDGRGRAELEGEVQKLGLEDRFLITGWQDNARRLLDGFDIFALPSRYEGFPFAILEAMAAGLPCVVADVDGVREAVIDGVTGYLCSGDSVQQWTSRIEALGESREQRKQLGNASVERWRNNFSLESMALGTISVYEAAISDYRSTPGPAQVIRRQEEGSTIED